MQIGVVFPQTEIGNDPVAIRDYAQTAEGLGYSHILAYDHVLGANPERPGGWAGPYTYQTPFHEVFVLFGYLAGLTGGSGWQPESSSCRSARPPWWPSRPPRWTC